ncbi:MAG: mechanosensitive ion channel family protein [Acidobacteriota bacterium]|nr:mechanosensitive ion channel family protein [Acidobacteriota bacterium]
MLLFGLLCGALVLVVTGSWLTRDSVASFSFLSRSNRTAAAQHTLVDQTPWQTIQALVPLAVTQEELDYAHQAQRLADHEVDQAFAAALRQATLQQRTLTGEAQALATKVAQLQQTVKDDDALVAQLTPHPVDNNAAAPPDSDDLAVAKQQLGLDQDELADAQQDLARASGDQRSRIQQELTAREAAMAKFDAEQTSNTGQVAVLSAQQYRTLAHLVRAWLNQRSRFQLLQQAQQQSLADASTLAAQHNTLEASAGVATVANPSDTTQTRLATITLKRQQHQLLSIYDDRIQTLQQLTGIYSRWSAQVQVQHRLLLHLILQRMITILIVVMLAIVADAFVGRLTRQNGLDHRRMATLRTMLQLAVQLLGLLVVAMLVFGPPAQMPTIIGLVTAGLTVVLQDFIVAFFGWFVLMGKHGIRVGDTVEINGVSGEVVEVGLFRTTLLETGNWTDTGHPTGRRVSFINSFAIRGQFFNFSTAGQWMWDEISLSIPSEQDTYAKIERIHQVVVQQTEKDSTLAEAEWQRSGRHNSLLQFTAEPDINLRPASAGVELIVRYVTRASERFETRNRLYQSLLAVLQQNAIPPGGITGT